MKYISVKHVVLFSALAFAAAMSAQVQQKMNADIPFDFKVGASVFSAGHYMVTSPLPGIIELRESDSKQIATITTHSAESLTSTEKGKLVFHRYADVYYLSQVWGAGQTEGRELPRSDADRETAKNNDRPSIAMVRLNQ